MLPISQVSFYYRFITQGLKGEKLNTNNLLSIKVALNLFLDQKNLIKYVVASWNINH